MPEVHGKSGCQTCPDSWFGCGGNSAHPGAGEGKPRSHKSHGGILLFYFQPCFLRHKGLQIRCISEAYLCEYFTAYPSRTKSFKPSEVYPSRALSPHVTVWLLAAAAWSLLPPAAHLPSLCCSTALSTATLWSQPPCHLSDGLCSQQLLVGCICAAVSLSIICIPLTHVQSLGCGQSHSQSRAHSLCLAPGMKNICLFYGILMKLG